MDSTSSPTFADSSHADSSHADSSHADSSHADSSHADSSHADSSHADSSHADSSHADSSHADSSHADGVAALPNNSNLDVIEMISDYSDLSSPATYVFIRNSKFAEEFRELNEEFVI